MSHIRIQYEKYMCEPSVHEHMGYKLERFEKWRLEVEQCKVLIHEVAGNHCNYIHDYINQQQIFYYRGHAPQY